MRCSKFFRAAIIIKLLCLTNFEELKCTAFCALFSKINLYSAFKKKNHKPIEYF